jgi:lysophospholipase L1-like esterase
MVQAAWVSDPSKYVRIRPGIKIDVVSDSLAAPSNPGGWLAEFQNYCAMIYGDSAPTWFNHGRGGVTIENALSNGQITDAIADAPDVILFELGVNDLIFQTLQPASYWQGLATTAFQQVRASLPNCAMAWIGIWTSTTELRNPETLATAAANINSGIAAACAANKVQFIDVHSWAVTDQNALDPTGLVASGLNTIDGIHPNWRGRPIMSRAVFQQVFFDDVIYPPIGPSWTPDSDVAPTFFLEADQLSPGPVSAWGPWSTFPGATSPTCVSGGWTSTFPTGTGRSPMNCVRFNGTSDVIASGLTLPSGPKTLFALYSLRSHPASNAMASLLTMTNGTTTMEFMPELNIQSPPLTYFGCDLSDTGADGNIYVATQNLNYSLEGNSTLYPVRFSGTFSGGSSTTLANYGYYWGGFPLTAAQFGTRYAQPHATALNALGARIPDGVTPSGYAQVDLVALGLYPAVLSTVQKARVGEYLRRKWGP